MTAFAMKAKTSFWSRRVDGCTKCILSRAFCTAWLTFWSGFESPSNYVLYENWENNNNNNNKNNNNNNNNRWTLNMAKTRRASFRLRSSDCQTKAFDDIVFLSTPMGGGREEGVEGLTHICIYACTNATTHFSILRPSEQYVRLESMPWTFP